MLAGGCRKCRASQIRSHFTPPRARHGCHNTKKAARMTSFPIARSSWVRALPGRWWCPICRTPTGKKPVIAPPMGRQSQRVHSKRQAAGPGIRKRSRPTFAATHGQPGFTPDKGFRRLLRSRGEQKADMAQPLKSKMRRRISAAGYAQRWEFHECYERGWGPNRAGTRPEAPAGAVIK